MPKSAPHHPNCLLLTHFHKTSTEYILSKKTVQWGGKKQEQYM